MEYTKNLLLNRQSDSPTLSFRLVRNPSENKEGSSTSEDDRLVYFVAGLFRVNSVIARLGVATLRADQLRDSLRDRAIQKGRKAMKYISIACVILILAVAVLAGTVQAAVPKTMNYQGYLTNAGGQPVNGTVSMVFSLYNVDTGGTALWTETHQTVTVDNGIYNVVLGAGNPTPVPLALPFDTQYYLGITVGTDPEMTPRQPLTSVGTALRAAQADSVSSSATVASSQIAGQIPPSQIGAGTASININGNAVTATGLAANPANCASGSVAAGIAADGAAETCIVAASSNTAGAIVRRDGSGNFSGGVLTVGGISNSGSFSYSSAQTRYLSISASAFLPDDSTSDFTTLYSPNRRYISTAVATPRLVAPVQLPGNAVIKEWKCRVYDGSSTYNINIAMYYVNYTSLLDTLMWGTLSSTGSTGVQEVTSGTVNFTLDPNNMYYLRFFPDDGSCGIQCQLYGCQIRYEVNSAY